eukprot:Clim_evm14s238 gene=Clim_evmTU14s238
MVAAAPTEQVQSKTAGQSQTYREIIQYAKFLTAGGIAGAVSRTCVSPLERLKILFQVQKPGDPPLRIVKTLVDIYKYEGIMGYFKGNGTNVIRMVPYSAVQFASYEQYKKLLLPEGQKVLDTPRRLAAGALAGMTSVAATYPLDLIRTRLAAQEGAGKVKKYKGIAHAAGLILREEGGWMGGALYRGLIPTMMGIVPYVALNFTIYESIKLWCAQQYDVVNTDDLPVPVRLTAGAVAGAAAQTVTYPLDVIRRRMQVVGNPESGYKYKGTFDALVSIVRANGFKGLFVGMIPNYLKVVPSISISFVTYEWSKKILAKI